MNSLKRCVRLFMLALSCVALSSSSLRAQVKVHDPAEILKIVEESAISYGIDLDDETEAVTLTPEQLPSGYFMKEVEGKPTFGSYELSEEAKAALRKAEDLFAKEEYAGAIREYHKALEAEPEYAGALTMIGDSYYRMEEHDSARHYLRAAIEMNFIDYQAHWFLSSVELKLGNNKEGLHELTIAHVLNPGHEVLKKVLKTARKTYGDPWKEWSFAPRYELTDESLENVHVRCAPGWMMYALTKAVWEYEENYAQEMGVDNSDDISALALKEKEATMMFAFEYLARKEMPDEGEEEELNTEAADAMAERVIDIVKGGMIDPFIYYEVIGKENPILFSMMSSESVLNIAAYVEKHH